MKYKISKEKFKALKAELHSLLNEKKDQLNEDWRLAVEEGDDRETDALSVAVKLFQEHQIRIYELKQILGNCEVIDNEGSLAKKGVLGSELEIEIDGNIQTVILVDPIEADPTSGKISVETPLGKILIGGRVDKPKLFKAPNGIEKGVTIKRIN